MKITININKDGLSTKECQSLSNWLQIFDTNDIIDLLEGVEHSFKIGKDTLVKMKRSYNE
tara:strand:+ start:946 stop:1125 length:180 start_codon:yes stop_codon:yes gene_type:complete